MSGMFRPATMRSDGVPSLTLRDASHPTTRKAMYIASTAATAAVMSAISAARAAAFHGRCGLLGFTRDHHFGGLDDCEGIVAALEVQFFQCVRGDYRGQRLIADSQAYLAEQAVHAYFFDEAAQPVAAAERHDQPGRPLRGPRLSLWRRRVPGEQSLD